MSQPNNHDHDELVALFDKMRADADLAWRQRAAQRRAWIPPVEPLRYIPLEEARTPRASVAMWVRSVLLRLGAVLRGRR